MKEQIKKLVAFVTSALMALALVPGIALAATGTPQNPGKISVTSPDGILDGVQNTYTIYKIFDATTNGTATAYKLPSGITSAPDGFTADANGYITNAPTELSAEQIAGLKTYIDDNGITSSGTITTTGPNDTKLSDDLQPGYYYITTTTGTAVIVNANQTAAIKDKNTVPSVTKVISSVTDGNGSVDADGKNALAEVGSTVHYTATVTFGKGSKNVVFHDKMSDGLSLNADSISVTGLPDGATSTTNTDAKDGDTFDISFSDGIAEGTVATITYTATVTSDSLSSSPATNTAKVTYGDPSNSTQEVKVNVYNAKFTVTKHDGNGQPLAGAGFVVKNAAGKYYKKDGNDVNWVDSIADATEYTSNADGAVTAFTGLANGTYTLVEKTVPAGYNKAADSTFTVVERDYASTNLEQSSTVTNNAGTALPTTGGMGTTLFTVVGAALVVAAGVLLVTRRRMQQ